jgi:hypothetical protein
MESRGKSKYLKRTQFEFAQAVGNEWLGEIGALKNEANQTQFGTPIDLSYARRRVSRPTTPGLPHARE